MSLSPFGRRGVAEADQMGAEAVIGVDVDHESIQIGQGAACSWSAPQAPPSSSSSLGRLSNLPT
jgi:hypothetical protein